MAPGAPKLSAAGTLCWRCRNAVPDPDGRQGCSWSRDFEPVKGWTAVPQLLKCPDKDDAETFHVVSCPEFVPDPPQRMVYPGWDDE